MITILKQALCICIGFGSGVVVSGAVFAFIAIIGIVPRIAQKTGTEKYIILYEEALMLGGVFAICINLLDFHLKINNFLIAIYFVCVGIFVGCLAVSIAEVLNVMPILTRRANIQKGLAFFIIALAVGKLVGSLLYFLIPGYYDPSLT